MTTTPIDEVTLQKIQEVYDDDTRTLVFVVCRRIAHRVGDDRDKVMTKIKNFADEWFSIEAEE
jgi:hypothetical protein